MMKKFKTLAALAAGFFVSLWLQAEAIAQEAAQTTEPHSPLPGYEEFIDDVLAMDLASIPLWRLTGAALILMAGILVRTTLLAQLMRPLEALTRLTKTEVDDELLKAIRRPMGWIFNLVAIYFAVLMLQLPETLHVTIVLILQTLGTGFGAWMVFNVVDAIGAYFNELARKTNSQIDDHLVPLIKRVLRIGVVLVTVITIIQQWGYDVTSLIAGLGIGGLAFALAAQSTLSNWFGSVMILTDRPFKVGDLVRSSHGDGTISDIGMRSTKICTFNGTIITVPNSDIATAPVENLNAMPFMNVRAEIGLTYSTPRDTVQSIIGRIREMLVRNTLVDESRSLACFDGFGQSSLKILVHCFIDTGNWTDWHLVREDLLFKIMAIVEEEGAEFAFPSQSVYFETDLNVRGQDASSKTKSEEPSPADAT